MRWTLLLSFLGGTQTAAAFCVSPPPAATTLRHSQVERIGYCANCRTTRRSRVPTILLSQRESDNDEFIQSANTNVTSAAPAIAKPKTAVAASTTTASTTVPTTTATTTATTTTTTLLQPGTTVHEITFAVDQRRPLGCTVEESLANAPTDDKNDGEAQQGGIRTADAVVLVTALTKGGHADVAGLRVGDVVVAVTGLFGGDELQSVTGMEDVMKLVAANKDQTLVWRIVRGTNSLEQHEEALATLCANPDMSDHAEECVLEFLRGGYYDMANEGHDEDSMNEDNVDCIKDEDDDCLLDDMHNMWAEDLPPPPPTSTSSDDDETANDAGVAKPWSSRSSPSGTYVRDPATGKMRNIG